MTKCWASALSVIALHSSSVPLAWNCSSVVFEAGHCSLPLIRWRFNDWGFVTLSANLYKFVCLSFLVLGGFVPLTECLSYAVVTLGISLLLCCLSMCLCCSSSSCPTFTLAFTLSWVNLSLFIFGLGLLACTPSSLIVSPHSWRREAFLHQGGGRFPSSLKISL